jgi:hypothetical protein
MVDDGRLFETALFFFFMLMGKKERRKSRGLAQTNVLGGYL